MTLARMLRLMAGTMGLRFAGAGLGLITQLVLTRSFAQADVGVIFLGMSMAAFFSLCVAVGYPLLALTQLPRFYTLGLTRLTRAFHGIFLKDMVVTAMLIFAAVAVVWLGNLAEPGLRVALLFGALSAVPSALIRYNCSVANSLRYYQWAFLPDFIIRPGLFLGYLLSALLLHLPLTVSHCLLAFVVSNVIVACVQAVVVGAEGVQPSDWFKTHVKLTAALRRRSVALAIVGAVTVMFADVVTLLGGLILPHDQLAILGLCIRLAGIAGFVIQATQQFILPDLTAALTRRDERTAHHLLLRLNLLTVVTLALGLVAATILGGWLLSLFGPDYRAGHWLLVLFLCGQSIRAMSGMNQNLLSIAGRQVRSAAAAIIGMLLFAGLWIAMAPKLGLFAAGWAVILAELAWALMLATQAKSLLGRRADLFWLIKHPPE